MNHSFFLTSSCLSKRMMSGCILGHLASKLSLFLNYKPSSSISSVLKKKNVETHLSVKHHFKDFIKLLYLKFLIIYIRNTIRWNRLFRAYNYWWNNKWHNFHIKIQLLGKTWYWIFKRSVDIFARFIFCFLFYIYIILCYTHTGNDCEFKNYIYILFIKD